jgi:hypothetical protein
MTDEAHNDDDETIEDLEAPAEMQQQVAGGLVDCISPTCLNDSKVRTWCQDGTCNDTKAACANATGYVVIYEQ